MKIAVLMGGTSPEREVSLNTGKAVVLACENLGYKTWPLVLNEKIDALIPILQSVDVVFNALHGGVGENGIVAGFLETLGVRYTGSRPLASALCMDKHISKTIVLQAGYLTPKWIYLCSEDVVPDVSSLSYPLVVKPNDQGSTVGLSIIQNESELTKAVQTAFQYAKEVIIENYIPGNELTVAILGKNIYPIVEIIPTHRCYDYECKYTQGMSQYVCPAELTKKQTDETQSLAKGVYSLLKCEHYGRVDIRLDQEGKPWFLELNTLPGMTDTSLVPKAAKAQGISFTQLIELIIEQA